MGQTSDSRTTVERTDRDLIVTRSFDAPARIVYAAWTTPELFKQWWAPKSLGNPLLSVEQDVRTGGGYSVTFGRDAASSMTFFGKYIEVVPNARLVWTNEEGPDGAVTTVTFEEKGGKTLLTLRESFPTHEALIASAEGMEGSYAEQFGQLDDLLAGLK